MEKSVVMQVQCEDEDCGVVSYFRMYSDGSFSRVLEACYHTKRMPDRETIRKEIELHETARNLPV